MAMEMKPWIMKPKHSGFGRGICAAIGIAIAAGLYYSGYAPAEPTALSGIAYAAAGAAGGVVIYGIFDIIRKIL
jgi:hypothetical protein